MFQLVPGERRKTAIVMNGLSVNVNTCMAIIAIAKYNFSVRSERFPKTGKGFRQNSKHIYEAR